MEEIEQHFEAQQKLFKQQADEQMKFAAKMRTYKFTAQNEFKTNKEYNKKDTESLFLANLENKENEIMPKGISKRKDGRYVIRKTIDGVRQVFYSRTLNEAKKIYTKLKHNIEIKPEKTSPTLEQWCAEWLLNYKKPFLTEKSFNDIKNIIAIINRKFGKYKLENLQTSEIQKYINSLPRNRTKERICTYFNAVLQKACDLDYIQKNIFAGVIREKRLKFKRNAYTFNEQSILLTALKGTVLEIPVLIYLLTGCRPTEFPEYKNFDFENNIIHIYGTKNSNALHREVYISENFKQCLVDYFMNNNLPTYNSIQKDYSKLCKQLNINSSLYTLRHTFATNMRVLGADTKLISTFMGHSTVQITLDIYTDVDKTLTKDRLIKLYNNLYMEF